MWDRARRFFRFPEHDLPRRLVEMESEVAAVKARLAAAEESAREPQVAASEAGVPLERPAAPAVPEARSGVLAALQRAWQSISGRGRRP